MTSDSVTDREKGEGAAVTAQVWDAVLGVAEAACGRKQGREAVAGLARKLSEVPGCDELAMRLAALAKPGTQVLADLRGWVGTMWRAGKLTEAEHRAALEIGRGVELAAGAASDGLRAVNPARLVVDGGPLPQPRLGGVGRSSPELARVAAWRADIAARPALRRVVKGSKGSMAVDELVLKVLVEGVAPFKLASQLGLRSERPQQVVLSELRAYARMHFSA